jgi:uncharacterized protein (TIGR00369 family)
MKPLEALQRNIRGESTEGASLNLPPPIAETLGFHPTVAEEGRAVFQMDAQVRRHANPMGTIHGGVLCDLADAAMGVACASLLEDGESFTTLELKINFLRPVWDAKLEARANAVHRGRAMTYVECEIVTLPAGKLVAKASSTCLVLRGEAAKGR